MVLESEQPPQTVRQAMSEGWTALAVVCPPNCKRSTCPKVGHIIFKDIAETRGNWRIADVFEKAVCNVCRYRPRSAKLGWHKEIQGLISWHEKDILIVDGYVVRPGRW